MPKQNLTQYAVLGQLNLEPKTGYDIKQFVETNMSHFWTESYRWIYATLQQQDCTGIASRSASRRLQWGVRRTNRCCASLPSSRRFLAAGSASSWGLAIAPRRS